MIVEQISEHLTVVSDNTLTVSDVFAMLVSNNASMGDPDRVVNEAKQKLGILTSEE